VYTLLAYGGVLEAGAQEAAGLWRSGGSSPEQWLATGHVYVSSVSATVFPGEPPCTLALVGQRATGGRLSIVGLAMWQGTGGVARRRGSVRWPQRDGWDYAINSVDILDLDGDGRLEIGIREAVGSDGAWIRGTTWYRADPPFMVPVYYLTRHVRTFDREEQRDMVVEGSGRLRERITVEQTSTVEGNGVVRHVYDIQYQYDSRLGRFAPLSTRMLR